MVPLDRLAAIKRGRVVAMGPEPVGIGSEIRASRLWQALPVVAVAPVMRIPAVWSFGGPPSASRLARLLAAALAGDGRRRAASAGPGA